LESRSMEIASVSGTIHMVPLVNPLAALIRRQDFPFEESRYRKLPHDRTANLDRLWGGGKEESPVLSAICKVLWEELLSSADAILDLHAWSEWFCPMAWAHERDQDLLYQSGFPFQVVRQSSSQPSLHTLREMAWAVNKPVLVAELPGQNTVRPASLDLGRGVIRNFLVSLGQFPAERRVELTRSPLVWRDGFSRWEAVAPASGLWHSLVPAGTLVSKGDLLGEIFCVDRWLPLAELRAGISGLVLFNGPPIWGEDHRESQLLSSGQPLVRIQSLEPTPDQEVSV
jgi:predicted deacylase